LQQREGPLKNFELQIQDEQKAVCNQYAAEFVAALGDAKSGFALSTNGQLPINGLRHPPTADTSGWYIWCGEQFSDVSDFFAPLCTSHIYDEYAEIAKLLGLPPGYRFLMAVEYFGRLVRCVSSRNLTFGEIKIPTHPG
jgi:hypothetical protein